MSSRNYTQLNKPQKTLKQKKFLTCYPVPPLRTSLGIKSKGGLQSLLLVLTPAVSLLGSLGVTSFTALQCTLFNLAEFCDRNSNMTFFPF